MNFQRDDDQPEWPRLEGSYVEGHWRGDHSLPRSFWLNYVVISIVLGVVVMVLFFLFFASMLDSDAISRDGDTIPAGFGIFILASVVFGSILGVWQLVGMWRSAAKCKLHTGKTGWATVVQILVVLGWLGFVLNWIQAVAIL